MRRIVPFAILVALSACRGYASEKYVSADKGLLDADQWAGYGPEQAVAVAIGREFGAQDATAAAEYAKKFPAVDSVAVDSLGHRLVITFASGWHAQVNPIKDGKGGDETAGLPN